jgi:hypothetical protein
MEMKVKFSSILLFFFGIVVGIVICICVIFAIVLNDIDPYIHLWRPKKFADITISPFKPEGNDTTESLTMKKGGKNFFYAWMDKTGKVTNIAIADQNDAVRFTMTVSEENGKWGNAMYFCDKPGNLITGEKYIDINFDGQFDLKKIFDSAGNLKSEFVYVDKAWKQVDRCNEKEAMVGRTTYIFDANHGWMK